MSTNGQRDGESIVGALPGLARVAVGAGWRTASWSIGASIRVSGRLARATAASAATVGLVHELAIGMREYTREILGVSELDARV
jgi:hypothetical protein